MDQSFLKHLFERHQECPECPSPKRVTAFFESLLGTLFPEFSEEEYTSRERFESHYRSLELDLTSLISFCKVDKSQSYEEKAAAFFSVLPAIYDLLNDDVTALEKGDPAAKSQQEVIRTYPGFYATAAYRFAHVLNKLNIPIIPRMLSEHAHSHTGIDIHPGAVIGRHFCIDHGTGIVIGETSVIKDYVKIYQGVTLGALSVRKEDATQKRHPTIEDHVVLYSGATILGGDTVIGAHSIIGGNVWVTRSIPPNSKVYYQAKMNDGSSEEEMDLFVYKTSK